MKRSLASGDHEQARSVLVESMYNACSWQLALVRKMMQQRVHHSVFVVAGARVNDQSSRFIYDDNVVI